MKEYFQSYCCGRISHRLSTKILLAIGIYFLGASLINHSTKRFKYNDHIKLSSSSIGIFIVANEEAIKEYEQHMFSLACYAYRHSYRFILMNPRQYPICTDMSRSIYFQKHCLVLMYLLENAHIQWLLVMEIDVLVLNISKKIESFLPSINNQSSIHMIFSERFNGEIAAGNYLIQNHPWSHAFLIRWGQYERLIVNIKFHNNDNGALHIHLLDKTAANVSRIAFKHCFRIYKSATEPKTYHTYVGCCKCALGGRWQFSHIKILRRGHSFVRDNLGFDMAKRIWSPTDFLLYGHRKNVNDYYSDKIDTYKCIHPQWILPVRNDAIMTNYTEVQETIRRFDREAAQGYPQSIGLPEISDCWPDCHENETRRQAFLLKVCSKNASWRSL